MTDLLVFLQFLVFVMGLTAASLAVRFMFFFAFSKKRLSFAMQFLLAEQVVTSVGTLAFAVNSLIGTVNGDPVHTWNAVPPLVAISLRLGMFAAMIHSTTFLSLAVAEVLTKDPCDGCK